MIKPTKYISRCRTEGYCALAVPNHAGNDQTVHATLYSRYNVISIGLYGEGTPDNGIVTDDPELVRWFAQQLLELADEMETVRKSDSESGTWDNNVIEDANILPESETSP